MTISYLGRPFSGEVSPENLFVSAVKSVLPFSELTLFFFYNRVGLKKCEGVFAKRHHDKGV